VLEINAYVTQDNTAEEMAAIIQNLAQIMMYEMQWGLS
jgi:hypothetical protein